MRISDWSSDVCSSDLGRGLARARLGDAEKAAAYGEGGNRGGLDRRRRTVAFGGGGTENRLGQAEVGKRCPYSVNSCAACADKKSDESTRSQAERKRTTLTYKH